MGITTRYAQEIPVQVGLNGLSGEDGADGADGGEGVGADPLAVEIIGGEVVLDLSRSTVFRLNLTSDVVISILAGTEVNGKKFSVALTQDGIGGWIATWWSPIRWSRGGTEPVLTATPDKRDVMGFEVWNDGVTISYDGFVIGQDI